MTVLFCDLVGSTALGEETDPEALRALLGRYFERMSGIVESHGGTVEKFIGDAVLAVFGVPHVHEDDALRACRAAVEMRDALPGLGIRGRRSSATTSNKPPATSPSAGRTADRSRLPPVSVSLAREGAPFGAATPVRRPDCSRVGSHSSGRTGSSSRSRSSLHVRSSGRTGRRQSRLPRRRRFAPTRWATTRRQRSGSSSRRRCA